MIKVIKRDGREKNFDKRFIEIAVDKAKEEVGINNDTLPIDIAQSIEEDLIEDNVAEINIEEIQDMVIKALKEESPKVAEAYKNYREKRNLERDRKSKFLKDIEDIFNQTSEEIRNNANKAGDKLQTYRAMIADVACNNYADTKIIPERLLKKHKKTIYVFYSSRIFKLLNEILILERYDITKNTRSTYTD